MKRIIAFIKSPPLILAFIAALAYGILAPQLGFYWDDLPIGWIRYQLGAEALIKYFSTNRPALGILYQSLTDIIPYQPVYWQFLALFLRWSGSVLLWATLRQIFPSPKRLSLIAALLFLVYPGFTQQSVAFVYSSHFTALFFFFFSLYAMLKSIQETRFSRLWMFIGIFTSAVNLLLGEYFFLLDLIRVPIIWIAFRNIPAPKRRKRRALAACLPYLIVFLAAIIGRIFFITNQTYEYSLLAELRAAPLPALWKLFETVLLSLWTTLIAAWGQAFVPPDFALQGKVTIAIYLGVILISALVVKTSVLTAHTKQGLNSLLQSESFSLIFIGFISALLAGIPFWLTNLPVSLEFPANRATLPFIFGSVLILVGIFSLIPHKNVQIALLTLLIAFSAGRQFLWADEFRRDWNVQKNLFWQMSWRIPALEENTTILLNEGALKFYADNSLSAPLNWIYAPDASAEKIPYMLFYPRTRFGIEGEKLETDLPLFHNFIAGEFHGNTNQMLLIDFSPPGCLHIVDPELDAGNRFIGDLLLRDAVSFSRPALILLSGEQPRLPDFYAPEPARGWCYYFEKAELARQRGAWAEVVSLGEQAFALDDHPNDPTERFVFVEGYAQTGAWEQAEQLSLRANRVSPSYVSPLLCRLWTRIERDAPESPSKDASVAKMRRKFDCAK